MKADKALRWLGFLGLGLLLGYVLLVLVVNATEKISEDSEEFFGVLTGPNDRPGDKYIVIVHGIGSHCVGYAQQMIEGVAKQGNYVRLDKTNKTDEKSSKNEESLISYDAEDCKKLGSFSDDDFDTGKDRDRTNYGKVDCEKISSHDALDRTRHGGSVHNCKRIAYGNETLGFLRRVAYQKPEAESDKSKSSSPSRMIAYEVTWDPSTSFIKSKYLNFLHSLTENHMQPINEGLKDRLLHNGLADAVLYISEYKRFMQYPLVISLCEILLDMEGMSVPRETLVDCGYEKAEKANEVSQSTSKAARNSQDSELSIITHSLGSRMVYDTLIEIQDSTYLQKVCRDYHIGRPAAEVDKICQSSMALADKLVKNFNGKINKIFMMANQIPLLSIPEHAINEMKTQKWRLEWDSTCAKDTTDPAVKSTCAEMRRCKPEHGIGYRLKTFVEEREKASANPQPLQLVSFTESDDLLNYDFPCWIKTGTPFHQTDVYGDRKESRYKLALQKLLDSNYECKNIQHKDGDIASSSTKLCRDTLIYLSAKNGTTGHCRLPRQEGEAPSIYDEFLYFQNLVNLSYLKGHSESARELEKIKEDCGLSDGDHWDKLKVETHRKAAATVAFNQIESAARSEDKKFDELMTVSCNEGENELNKVLEEWEKSLNLNLVNVKVRMGFWAPGLGRNPAKAHSGYWDSPEIHALIAKGFSSSAQTGRSL